MAKSKHRSGRASGTGVQVRSTAALSRGRPRIMARRLQRPVESDDEVNAEIHQLQHTFTRIVRLKPEWVTTDAEDVIYNLAMGRGAPRECLVSYEACKAFITNDHHMNRQGRCPCRN